MTSCNFRIMLFFWAKSLICYDHCVLRAVKLFSSWTFRNYFKSLLEFNVMIFYWSYFMFSFSFWDIELPSNDSLCIFMSLSTKLVSVSSSWTVILLFSSYNASLYYFYLASFIVKSATLNLSPTNCSLTFYNSICISFIFFSVSNTSFSTALLLWSISWHLASWNSIFFSNLSFSCCCSDICLYSLST